MAVYENPEPTQWLVGKFEHTCISICRMAQGDGSFKFKVENEAGFVLNAKTARFCYEARPSARADNHAETFRFNTLEEATQAGIAAAKVIERFFPGGE